MRRFVLVVAMGSVAAGCGAESRTTGEGPGRQGPEPDHRLSADNFHHKFSRAIPPVLRVESGAVVEAFTHEATGSQLKYGSTLAELDAVDWDRTHALTGPVYVEGAEPGDILAVTLLEIEPGDWGWNGIWPGEGLLAGDIDSLKIRTFRLDKASARIEFANGITIPLAPFAGVMGVAPDTDEMLSTTPPRANGGNLDDPHLAAGTTVYFPVFVPGALFSIGDTHAAQGLGEIGGSALEAPMRIVYRLAVIKHGSAEHRSSMREPQYETNAYYATTGFATTLEEASRKAARYMLDYLVDKHGLARTDAYMLCSLACDLKIAQLVNKPHVLVAMHVRKDIFPQ